MQDTLVRTTRPGGAWTPSVAEKGERMRIQDPELSSPGLQVHASSRRARAPGPYNLALAEAPLGTFLLW